VGIDRLGIALRVLGNRHEHVDLVVSAVVLDDRPRLVDAAFRFEPGRA